jgi:hypothetical protein
VKITLRTIFWAMAVFLVGVLIGNYEGDQATIRDCAQANEARMAGGGSITCSIVKEPAGQHGTGAAGRTAILPAEQHRH